MAIETPHAFSNSRKPVSGFGRAEGVVVGGILALVEAWLCKRSLGCNPFQGSGFPFDTFVGKLLLTGKQPKGKPQFVGS